MLRDDSPSSSRKRKQMSSTAQVQEFCASLASLTEDESELKSDVRKPKAKKRKKMKEDVKLYNPVATVDYLGVLLEVGLEDNPKDKVSDLEEPLSPGIIFYSRSQSKLTQFS